MLARARTWAGVSATVAALAGALVAGCGGGVQQAETFVPARVLVFGDDSSALLSDGRRWGINGLDDSTGAFDCNQAPIWVQSVASNYGLAFAQCSPDSQAQEPRALMFAAAQATVADLAGQVATLDSVSSVRSSDLALVMAGANDVWALYEQYPARSEASLLADMRDRGAQLATVVNRLVARGARVVVVDLPDLGMSPYARAEQAVHADTGFDRAALLSRMASAFNESLGINVVLDGRFVGLVQLGEHTRAIARSPGSYGFADIAAAACSVPVPDCTTATLQEGANASTYLWADDRQFSPGGQAQIAGLALSRISGNPF